MCGEVYMCVGGEGEYVCLALSIYVCGEESVFRGNVDFCPSSSASLVYTYFIHFSFVICKLYPFSFCIHFQFLYHIFSFNSPFVS